MSCYCGCSPAITTQLSLMNLSPSKFYYELVFTLSDFDKTVTSAGNKLKANKVKDLHQEIVNTLTDKLDGYGYNVSFTSYNVAFMDITLTPQAGKVVCTKHIDWNVKVIATRH